MSYTSREYPYLPMTDDRRASYTRQQAHNPNNYLNESQQTKKSGQSIRNGSVLERSNVSKSSKRSCRSLRRKDSNIKPFGQLSGRSSKSQKKSTRSRASSHKSRSKSKKISPYERHYDNIMKASRSVQSFGVSKSSKKKSK